MARRSLDLGAGKLCLAVVADTHSRPHPSAHALIAAEKPDAIVHAGDIGDASVLSDLERIAKVIAVRGNIDSHEHDAPEALTLDLRAAEQVALRILLVHIAVIGPKLRGDVAATARREGARLVICGHSHVPFIGSDRGLGVFNPGSIGPRRSHLPIVFGVLNVEQGKIRMRHVDCETGKTWEP
jgi:hypothetical protein